MDSSESFYAATSFVLSSSWGTPSCLVQASFSPRCLGSLQKQWGANTRNGWPCAYEIGCSHRNSEREATILNKSSEVNWVFPTLDYRNWNAFMNKENIFSHRQKSSAALFVFITCEHQILLPASQWHLSLFSLQILRLGQPAAECVCSDALLLDEHHAVKSKLKQ